MENTLLLIDGNALMHRAYHALPPFKTKDGVPTNALYGFLSMLQKAIVDFKPTHLAVCFDTPAPTFRKKIFAEYQAHRPKLDDQLILQMPLVREALDKAGITRLEKPGFEADDLIGTITAKLKNQNTRILIFTGDKDILQLVSDRVFVIAPLIGLANVKLYDREEVKKKFSLEPEQIPDLKGLMGDASDNYSGAKGIGPKTAAQLLGQFSSIENLFKNISTLKNERIKKILETNKENIFLSKQLAQIKTDIDIDFDLNKTIFTTFKPELKDYLGKLEIHSLNKRLFSDKKTETLKKVTKKETNEKSQISLF